MLPPFESDRQADACRHSVTTRGLSWTPLFHYDGLGRAVKRPIPNFGTAWQMYDGANVALTQQHRVRARARHR